MFARLIDLLRPRPKVSPRESVAATVSRRDLALLGAAGIVAPGVLDAGIPDDPVEAAATLRGLAALGLTPDPVLSDKADTLVADLARTRPDAPLSVALHRAYRGNFSQMTRGHDPIDADLLRLLHTATQQSRPVSFAYRDLKGDRTARRVLPVELVYPPSGILLLAWCELRSDYRKFFVRELTNISIGAGDFTHRRLALLQGFLDREGMV